MAGAIKDGLTPYFSLQIYNSKYGFAKNIYEFLASTLVVVGKWFLLHGWWHQVLGSCQCEHVC